MNFPGQLLRVVVSRTGPPRPTRSWKRRRATRIVAGQFIWTGFDYLGEPTPYNNDTTNLLNFSDPAEKAKMAAEMKELGKLRVPSRSSYFGAVDLAGFPKDLFYLLQAAWRPELPMAHILPHWNWPERVGQVTPVMVFHQRRRGGTLSQRPIAGPQEEGCRLPTVCAGTT